MDIADFIRARLDEDEAAALAARATTEGKDYPWHAVISAPADDADHIARHDPARVLREVAAKRAILARHDPCDDWSYGDPSGCPELRALASVWADHPDCRHDWKPLDS